jgi:hypothetical protein
MESDNGGKHTKQSPFFSRYLEGQERLQPEESARVVGRQRLAYKQSGGTPIQTRKFPSDQDELDLCLHYRDREEVPAEYRGGGGRVTLKFPSDSDEEFWQAEYVEEADIPRGRKVRPKAANVSLKKGKAK